MTEDEAKKSTLLRTITFFSTLGSFGDFVEHCSEFMASIVLEAVEEEIAKSYWDRCFEKAKEMKKPSKPRT